MMFFKMMNSKNTTLLSGLFLFLFVGYITASQTVAESIERLKADVVYLASEELEGREPGTKGNELAEIYIENRFRKLGLKSFNNKYKQPFEVPAGLKVAEANNLFFMALLEREAVPIEHWRQVRRSWTTNVDWRPVAFSENGEVKDAELVFVGYGVTAPSLNYDDYEGIDVKGKVVVCLSDSLALGKKNHFLGDYSDLRYKATNARNQGAAAIIFIKTQSDSADVFYPLEIEQFSSNSGIIAIQANRTSIAKIFPRQINLFPLEQEINKTQKPKSFIIQHIKINLNVQLETDKKQVNNIVAYIDGTDSKFADEYIVVGAHFDHLGMGGTSSLHRSRTPRIHFGADDNSSGVAAMLELAKRLKAQPLKRPVIFVGFNAEERGLIGSNYFVNNSPIELDKYIFMLNLDMIGRMRDNKFNVFGTGSSDVFAEVIEKQAELDSLEVVKVKDGFSPSDHASFLAKDIPVMMFFTGIHSDYHTPNDTWDKINFNGLASIVDFSEAVLKTLGNNKKKPDFIKTTGYDPNSKELRRSHGNEAWFGIIPNFEENPNGFLINGTSAGSPAQKAGLTSGDIITEFANKTIKNLYDLTFAIRECSPGDTVIVKYIRDEEKKSSSVILKRR